MHVPTDAQIHDAVQIAWKLYRHSKPATNTRTEQKPVPLNVIAAELGLTSERVRQIEKEALAKCRRWADRHGLSLFDLLYR